MKQIAIPLCLIALIAGCGLINSTDTAVYVSTDKEIYVVGEAVMVSVVNESSHPVYLSLICDLESERRETSLEILADGNWHQPPPPQGCQPVYIWHEIAAGERHSIVFEIDEPGTYRYRFGLYARKDVSAALPETKRLSNVFVVQE